MGSAIKKFRADASPQPRFGQNIGPVLDDCERRVLEEFDQWRQATPNIDIIGVDFGRRTSMDVDGEHYAFLRVLFDAS